MSDKLKNQGGQLSPVSCSAQGTCYNFVGLKTTWNRATKGNKSQLSAGSNEWSALPIAKVEKYGVIFKQGVIPSS